MRSVRLFSTSEEAFSTSPVDATTLLGPLRVRGRDRSTALQAVVPVSVSFTLPSLTSGAFAVIAELRRGSEVLSTGEFTQTQFNDSTVARSFDVSSTLSLLAVEGRRSRGRGVYRVRYSFSADAALVDPILSVGRSTLTATTYPEADRRRD